MNNLQEAIDFIEELRDDYIKNSYISVPSPNWVYQLAKNVNRRAAFDTALLVMHEKQVSIKEKPKEKCDFCKDGRPNLYNKADWDGGISFEYIEGAYCPECGREIGEDE